MREIVLIAALVLATGDVPDDAPDAAAASPEVELRAPGGTSAAFLAAVHDKIRGAYQFLAHEFPQPINVPIQCRIAPDIEWFRAHGGRSGYYLAAATRDGLILQPAVNLYRARDLDGALLHEVAHLFLAANAGPALPTALHEGIATLVSNWPVRVTEADAAAKAFTPDDLKRLDGVFSRATERVTLRAAYTDAALAAQKLATAAGGRKALLEALPRFRETPALDRWKLRDRPAAEILAAITAPPSAPAP